MRDPYLDAASGVLRNRLGISDPVRLAQVEADVAAVRIADLSRAPLPGLYDLDHLRAVHRRIFGDINDWAGDLRTVNISKASVPFCQAAHLRAEADRISGLIRNAEPLLDDAMETGASVALALGELNSLHPFREGNGRAQRSLLSQWLLEFGWKLDWAAIDPAQNVAACEAALVRVDLRPMETLLTPLLYRR